MTKYNIGDIVYILYKDKVHSCIIIGISIKYIKDRVSNIAQNVLVENSIEYKMVTIKSYDVPNESRIATPSGYIQVYQIDSQYGEHIVPEDKIYLTKEDVIKHITGIKNIIVKQ